MKVSLLDPLPVLFPHLQGRSLLTSPHPAPGFISPPFPLGTARPLPPRARLSLSRSLAIPPLFSLARPPAEASGPGRPRGRIPITSIPPDAMFSMGSGCMLPLTGHEWGRYLLVAARANGKHNIRGVWGPLECGGGAAFRSAAPRSLGARRRGRRGPLRDPGRWRGLPRPAPPRRGGGKGMRGGGREVEGRGRRQVRGGRGRRARGRGEAVDGGSGGSE